jgi:hypothetical protein
VPQGHTGQLGQDKNPVSLESLVKILKSVPAAVVLAFFAFPVDAADIPDPDGKPADMAKPVKVFIVMGQSNTLEMGGVAGDKDGKLEFAVKNESLYPFMIDDDGNWTTRQDVRNVHTMGSGGPGGRGGVRRNDWLTVSGGKIGIEQGIGHQLGTYLDEPVLILKSSIGNRSLGWDLLPPGSERYEYTEKDGKTYVYAGSGDTFDRWEKGTEPSSVNWHAGVQYEGDVARAKSVLAKLGEFYPGAKKYEVAGFIWWQGDKDRYKEGHAAQYGKNLVALIASLRKDFDAPDAKFVCATLGQTNKDNPTGNEKMIIDGMFSLLENEELKGDVGVVYSHPLSMGGASNGHYGGNAKTYMNVGLGLGGAMVELLKE